MQRQDTGVLERRWNVRALNIQSSQPSPIVLVLSYTLNLDAYFKLHLSTRLVRLEWKLDLRNDLGGVRINNLPYRLEVRLVVSPACPGCPNFKLGQITQAPKSTHLVPTM
jgi:hypothetical protein